ncbi:MAG: asparaginase [Oscillospiraceae bacterium]|nr:asparaginase [Oscillospiraceae bacterium]
MKKILWLQAGGTIACVKTHVGLSPVLNSDSPAIESILPHGISYKSENVFSIDSADITPAHWKILAGTIFENREKYDGFVITHGTDALQYSAAALSFMLVNFDKPVIFTGSMKPFSIKDSDAPFNLASAFAVARDLSDCDCGGVFVVFAGKIIGGDSCVKISSRDTDAFTGVNGSAGSANSDGAKLFATLPNSCLPPVLKNNFYEKVFYLKVTPNISGDIVDFLLEKEYKGAVCEAYGLGGIPHGFLERLGGLVKSGVRVVIVSQCLFGGVDLSVYAAHKKALELGIEAWNMTGAAALARLMLELGEN